MPSTTAHQPSVADRDAAFRTAARTAAASRHRVYGDDDSSPAAIAHSRAVFDAEYLRLLGL